MPRLDAGKHDEGQLVDGDVCWKSNRSFVLRLGCVTAGGAMADIGGMMNTSISLSKELSITGFQDGDGHAAGQQSLIEVNSSFLVALEPEAIGRVFGMEFEGETVEKKMNPAKRIEVMQLIAKSHKAEQSGRVFFKSFRSLQLRTYVRQRKEQLHLLDMDRATLTWSDAYSLQREFFRGPRYNWAASKVNLVKTSLKTTKPSREVRYFLAQYISAVAPTVQETYKRLEIVGGRRAPGPGPARFSRPAVQKQNEAPEMEAADSGAARRVTRQGAKPKRSRALELGWSADHEAVDDCRFGGDKLSRSQKGRKHCLPGEVQPQFGKEQMKETGSMLLTKARDETKECAVQILRLMEARQRQAIAVLDLEQLMVEFLSDKLEFQKQKHLFEKERFRDEQKRLSSQ